MSSEIIINGIKWNIGEKYIYGYNNCMKFLDFIQLTDKLPLINLDIKFSEDFWDFNEINIVHSRRNDFRFNFVNIPNEYKKIIKYYICLKICEDENKIPTIQSVFRHANEFFQYLHENNIFEIQDVTLNNLVEYFKSCNIGLSIITIKNKKNSIKSLLEFYSSNFKEIDLYEIKKYLNERNTKLINAIAEQNKIPAIPVEYFSKMIKLLKKEMENESLNKDDRAFAALMIIATQTGLRTSDLSILEINMIKSIKLSGDRKAYFLNYRTVKAGEGNNGTIPVFSVINELSYKAYMIITNIYENNRNKKKTKFLYTPTRARYFPVDGGKIMHGMRRFAFKHCKELNSINNKELKDLTCIKIRNFKYPKYIIKYLLKEHKFKLNDDDELYYPTIHQIRVTVATDLYNKGVPLDYIEKYMAHLSSEMNGYYVRPKDNSQEDVEYSHKILEEVLTGKTKLLGKKDNISSLVNKIDEFIVNGNYNVEKDIDEIIKKLLKKIPIRRKLGGVCINSSMLRDCKMDDSTNEFYCAYGICPNHFHFFYNCNISYDEYNELKKTYAYNKENKFIRQAQKEGYKMTRLIEDTLLPELDELNNEVIMKGKNTILSNYSQVSYIINNFKSIYSEISKTKQEVEKWMMLKK